jgi:hypothetical protein
MDLVFRSNLLIDLYQYVENKKEPETECPDVLALLCSVLQQRMIVIDD